jgi:DNA-directed RNA polymerase specialized sigma24 family protein
LERHAREQALILAVRAGDNEAMGRLYTLHRADALSFSRSLTRNVQDAEDVFHEAFTKTINAIVNGAGPTENFGAYFFTAVRATSAYWWKRHYREFPVEAAVLDHNIGLDPRLEAVIDHAGNEHILAALQSLPERWRKPPVGGSSRGTWARRRACSPLMGGEARTAEPPQHSPSNDERRTIRVCRWSVWVEASHTEPRDVDLVNLLDTRDGIATLVTVEEGDTSMVFNIAWGYDLGDEYAHVTTNASPFIAYLPIDFFLPDRVAQVRDASTGSILFSRSLNRRVPGVPSKRSLTVARKNHIFAQSIGSDCNADKRTSAAGAQTRVEDPFAGCSMAK